VTLGKLMTALFGASVALNLVLGGWVLMLSGDRGPPSLPRLLARLEGSLPAGDRPAFAAALDKDRPRYTAAFDEARAARRAMEEIARREPFDIAALRRAIAATNQRWLVATDAFGESLAQGMAAISPEGRRALVDAAPKERE
jgi:uncharacterized membrane protein